MPSFNDIFALKSVTSFSSIDTALDSISLLISDELLIAVTNLIPYVGPVIGGVPACLFALLQSLPVFIGVLLAIVFIQILESVFLVPYITSKTVDIHEITTLLVLLIGGSLFGIIGALIAIPVYLVIRVVYEYYRYKKVEV